MDLDQRLSVFLVFVLLDCLDGRTDSGGRDLAWGASIRPLDVGRAAGVDHLSDM